MDSVIASPAAARLARAPQGWRDELGALLWLAGPLVGANLLQMSVYAIDVIFVARLNPVDFAAATLGVFMYSLTLWAMIGLTTACAPIMAAELGRRAHAVREVRRSFRMALWVAVLGSLPFLVLLANGEAILRLAGQDAAVAHRAGRFLWILELSLVPALAAAVMRTVAAVLGRPGWAMAVSAMAVLSGIVGNWALVFGHLGMPALGLEGSALASVITTLLMLAAFVAILMLDRRLRRYRLFGRWWRPEWPRFVEIVRLGTPIALSFTLEGSLFGGAAVLMGLISVTAVAAHAIALNIAAITFQIPLGIAQAATIRVGLAYGAGDRAWMGRAGRVALCVGVGIMAVTAALIWALPGGFVGIYIDRHAPGNGAVAALAIQFLMVAAAFQLLDGCQVVAAGVLRGIQDTRVPMIIGGIGYWIVGFGTAVTLGFGLGWGGLGVWVGLAVGLLAVAVPLLWRWSARERLGLVRVTAS